MGCRHQAGEFAGNRQEDRQHQGPEEMNSAERRIENVYAQVKACDEGRTNVITCPYCGGLNKEDVDFCCELFGQASIAALERLRVEQGIEVARKITERHANN